MIGGKFIPSGMRSMINFSQRRILLLIIAGSVLVRVAAALYLGDKIDILPGTHDQISYSALAQNVAAGKGFVFDRAWYPFTPPHTPTAHWSFLYVLYLAAVYAVVGYHPLVARLIQAVIVGVLMPWLVYRLGRRTFGEPVGLAAAAAISVYIYLVYYSATLMTEPFYIVALLWSLDILQRIGSAETDEIGRWRPWIELGLAWGIAVLLRQQALLLIPFFLLWLLWATHRRAKIRQIGPSAAASLAIVVAFILPWTIRNYIVYHNFLPLNSNVGYALYAANHPMQGNRFEPLNIPPVPEEWRGMNEAELNRRLTMAGIQFVLDDPGRFALQSLDRFRNYFRFWPEKTSAPISNISRVLSFGLYLPFMLYGLYLSVRLLRSRSDHNQTPNLPITALLYLYAFVYSGIHLLSWAMHRYRLPVDAVLMVFVGLAWVDLGERILHRKRGSASPS